MELTQKKFETERAKLSAESMTPADTNSATTQLSIDYVTADVIGVSYATMAGNQPNTYGNYIALWQNTESIPWNTEPLKMQSIDTNTPAGSTNFTGLTVTNNSYIIGYAVSPSLEGDRQKQGNICATGYIPASGQANQYPAFAPSLQMQHVGVNSIAVGFNLPSGVLPQTNNAWIGIWRSQQGSYNNPPLASNNIQVNASSGTAFINSIEIGRGLTYTVALFTSGWKGANSPSDQHPMACSVTFTN